MPKVRVLILRAPGTNCDQETAFAFQQAGGDSRVMHINRLLEQPAQADEYQVLCLPGGFSYGDDIAAGRIVAGQLRHHLVETFQRFRDAGKLILGICNGFQILLKSGLLLPDDAQPVPPATLTWNDSGHFEDRWVHLKVDQDRCVFLRGIDTLYLPIAHAEGKFVARDATTLQRLSTQGQLALRYWSDDAPPASADAALAFPANPNGSQANVAGVCDETGRVFGLMPHPERFIHRTQHPHWTRRPGRASADGLPVFRNAVKYFA
jgi:phosphoribosylformylglycinamidine synthase subunit PurQ / glutaminase